MAHILTEANVRYSALVLDEDSQRELINSLAIPRGWEQFAHHMTINMGPLKDKSLLGTKAQAKVVAVGMSDKAMAVKVETSIPSANKIKHVTIAVNRLEGGKPVMSNQITDWRPLDKPFTISGTVQEVS